LSRALNPAQSTLLTWRNILGINKNYILSIVAVMFLWAICYPLIVIGLDHAPHLSFAALRASLAGFSLLLLAFVMGKQHPQNLSEWFMLLGIGIGATTLGFYGMFHASEFVKPGVATVITNTQPILTAVLAAYWLKELINRNAKIGVLLGFIGVLVIASESFIIEADNRFALTGLFYLMIAVVGIAVSNILIKKIVGKIDGLIAMGWQLVLGSVFLWVIALSTENPSEIEWNTHFISSLLGLAILGTALAYWLWFFVLEKVSLSYANSYSFLAPIFGLLLGVLFYNESISLQTGIGIGVILLGIIMVNLPVRSIET